MVVELFAHGGGVKAVGDEAGGKREDRRAGVAVREGTRVGDEGEVDALGQFPGEGHASGVGDGGHHLARGGHAGVHPVPEGGEHGIAEVVVNIDGRILGKDREQFLAHAPGVAAVQHDDQAGLEGDGGGLGDELSGQGDPLQIVGDAGGIIEYEPLAERLDQGAHGSGGSDGVPVGAAVRHDDDVVELLDDRRHFLGGLDDMGRLHVLFVHCINPH